MVVKLSTVLFVCFYLLLGWLVCEQNMSMHKSFRQSGKLRTTSIESLGYRILKTSLYSATSDGRHKIVLRPFVHPFVCQANLSVKLPRKNYFYNLDIKGENFGRYTRGSYSSAQLNK